MRYVRFVIVPRDGYLDDIDRRASETPNLEREYLHNLNRLDDGTVTVLYEVTGDADAARRIAEESPEVLDYQLVTGGDRISIFGRIEPSPIQTALLDLLDEYELVLETPLTPADRGRLRASVIGTDAAIREAMSAAPEAISFDVERVTDYRPGTDQLFASLTDRQQEALTTALELGYYRVPREATLETVADHLDRSTGTVGEHLRKAEATVLSAIAP